MMALLDQAKKFNCVWRQSD